MEVVRVFELDRGDVPDRLDQPPMIEPVDPEPRQQPVPHSQGSREAVGSVVTWLETVSQFEHRGCYL